MRIALIAIFALAVHCVSAGLPPPVNDPEHVLVTGRVKKPGAIAPRDGLTLTEALEEVGGFADWPDRHHVYVWKSGEKRYIIVDAEAARRKEIPDPILQKGDVVTVYQYVMTGF